MKEALKLALEALEIGFMGPNIVKHNQAITAIKEALAQPEQEPVAWAVIASNTGRMCQVELDFAEVEELSPKWVLPLYTTPPQRKPLMDGQITAILERGDVSERNDCCGWHLLPYALARAIEAAHGIKGEA